MIDSINGKLAKPLRIAQALEHCLSNPVTNGWLIRHGHVPCESNPKTGGLSRTGDPAHALAEVTVSGRGFELRHVCRECAKDFYAHRPTKEGVIWS